MEHPRKVQLLRLPASYAVGLGLGGGSITDTSLSVTLTANGIKGIVKDTSNNVLSNADVNIFGPTQRFFRTAADGSFNGFGLRPGTYNLHISKPGYGFKDQTINIVSGVLDVGVTNLSQETLLIITATRPAGGYLPEVYGNIQAHTPDWSKQAFGNIHFGYGNTTADAGDFGIKR